MGQAGLFDPSMFSGDEGDPYSQLPDTVKQSVEGYNDGALLDLVGTRNDSIDSKHGSGASEWLKGNLDKFTLPQKLKMYINMSEYPTNVPSPLQKANTVPNSDPTYSSPLSKNTFLGNRG